MKYICEKCGAEFERNRTFRTCESCRNATHPCKQCGKPIPQNKKSFCSVSCRSRYNALHINPMNNVESRKKITETKRQKYGDSMMSEEGLERQRAQEKTIKMKATMVQRYGVEHLPLTDEAKEKMKSTSLERYGVEYPTSLPEIKAKVAATNLEKIGVTTNLLLSTAREKAAQTCLERYGAEYPVHTRHVEEVMRQKYGDAGLASPEIAQKKAETSLQRYGVTNPAKTEEVKARVRSVNLEKYGVPCALQNPEIYAKAVSTLQEKYGVSNAFLVGIENREPSFKSFAEDEIASFVSSLGVSVKRRDHSVLGNREIDIYCPDFKLGIEYNGMYWHSQEMKPARYHYDKTKRCAEKGVKLIHIYEWEWLNPVKRAILESVLLVSFGKVKKPLYARQCEIRDVSTKEYRDFCELNHLQGYRPAAVVYGLYHNNELKQLISFSKPQYRRAKESFQWEIVRGCPGSNNVVVGGVSRLWSHFLKEKKPESVMSYCDLNKFDGRSYLELGMSLYKTEPANAYYINKTTGKVQQWLFRNKERREEQLANSFVVHGAGNATFVWRSNENKIN